MTVTVGYHIDNFGEGTPICVRDSKGEALGEAIYRVLSLGITNGGIGTRECPLSADDARQLRDITDDWFAKASNREEA